MKIFFSILILSWWAMQGKAQIDSVIFLSSQKYDSSFYPIAIGGTATNIKTNDADSLGYVKYLTWNFSFKENGVSNSLKYQDEIKSSLLVLAAIDSIGQFIVIPDLNFNSSFTDDKKYIYDTLKIANASCQFYWNKINIQTLNLNTSYNNQPYSLDFHFKLIPKPFIPIYKKLPNTIAEELRVDALSCQYLTGNFYLSGNWYKIVLFSNRSGIQISPKETELFIQKDTIQDIGNLRERNLLPNTLEDTILINNAYYKFDLRSPYGNILRITPVSKADTMIGLTVGKKAIDFTRVSIKKKDVSLYESNLEFTLLDFWASYCGPCIASFEKLQQLQKKWTTKRLRIIGIANDDDDSVKVINLLAKKKINWENILDVGPKKKLFDIYRVRSMPTYILMNKKSEIIFRDVSCDRLIDFLNKIETQNGM